MRVCKICGMWVNRDAYHPYAACLMYQACADKETVEAQLRSLKDYYIAEDAKKRPKGYLGPVGPVTEEIDGSY